MSDVLIKKFQDLKAKHDELVTEKVKYEAKRDQLNTEIKEIQNKYPNYDLSTIESVENLITDLTTKLDAELTNINKQYLELKAVQV